jgi:hypothetical protein
MLNQVVWQFTDVSEVPANSIARAMNDDGGRKYL